MDLLRSDLAQNVFVLVRLCGNVFAVRRVAGQLVFRKLERR